MHQSHNAEVTDMGVSLSATDKRNQQSYLQKTTNSGQTACSLRDYWVGLRQFYKLGYAQMTSYGMAAAPVLGHNASRHRKRWVSPY